MVATVIVNQRYDQASAELREVLDGLDVASLAGSLDWIDNVSRPSMDGPNPRDEAALRAFSVEVNLALAKTVLALQDRVEKLEGQPRQTTKKK